MSMEDEFGDLPALSAQEVPSLAAHARTGEDTGCDMIEDIVLHSSTNIVVSPFAELLDLDGFNFDGNCDWAMTINLPWFQLQQKLELQGSWSLSYLYALLT